MKSELTSFPNPGPNLDCKVTERLIWVNSQRLCSINNKIDVSSNKRRVILSKSKIIILIVILTLSFAISSCLPKNVELPTTTSQTSREDDPTAVEEDQNIETEGNIPPGLLREEEIDPGWYKLELIRTDWEKSEDGIYIHLLAKNTTNYDLIDIVFNFVLYDTNLTGENKYINLGSSADIVLPGGYVNASLNLSKWYEDFSDGWVGKHKVGLIVGADLDQVSSKEYVESVVNEYYPYIVVTDYWFDEKKYLHLLITNTGETELDQGEIKVDMAITTNDGSFFTRENVMINETKNCEINIPGGICEAIIHESPIDQDEVNNIIFIASVLYP